MRAGEHWALLQYQNAASIPARSSIGIRVASQVPSPWADDYVQRVDVMVSSWPEATSAVNDATKRRHCRGRYLLDVPRYKDGPRYSLQHVQGT